MSFCRTAKLKPIARASMLVIIERKIMFFIEKKFSFRSSSFLLLRASMINFAPTKPSNKKTTQ